MIGGIFVFPLISSVRQELKFQKCDPFAWSPIFLIMTADYVEQLEIGGFLPGSWWLIATAAGGSFQGKGYVIFFVCLSQIVIF